MFVDESLADMPLANVLRILDYNARAVKEVLPEGTKDEVLLGWLSLQGGVWVTADDRARRRHNQAIRAAGVNVLWVTRPRDGMSKKAQAYLLLGVLDKLLDGLVHARDPRWFRAYYSGERPKLEELSPP